ncbi:MAG: hypothetical protein PVI62_13465 [Desulfobacterales bacterium]
MANGRFDLQILNDSLNFSQSKMDHHTKKPNIMNLQKYKESQQTKNLGGTDTIEINQLFNPPPTQGLRLP